MKSLMQTLSPQPKRSSHARGGRAVLPTPAREFNSLDAQREAAQIFITGQRHAGWVALPESYDDGGFSGGNMDRPALQRLLADIAARKVGCVVVYKVDRRSRSLLHFARMMEFLEQHRASFVSVTQQSNTTTSLGRLTRNILSSFAEFERDTIITRRFSAINNVRALKPHRSDRRVPRTEPPESNPKRIL